jgi:hypothetical protein
MNPSAHAVTALDIVTHTPTWVWFVFAGLVWFSLKRTQDRIVAVPRLLVFPIIVIAIEAYGLAETGLTVATGEGLLLGAVAGAGAGFLLERRNAAARLDDGRLLLKGEWTSLLLVVVIFATRYASAVIANIDPATAAGDSFHFVVALLSAFFALVMLTRTALRLRVAFA